jgi:hypothetical protein
LKARLRRLVPCIPKVPSRIDLPASPGSEHAGLERSNETPDYPDGPCLR